jgi:hypothetical protein
MILLYGMLVAATAAAHPGHGRSNDSGLGLLHYLSEPEHAVVLIALLAAAVAGLLLRRLAKRRRPVPKED